MTVPGPPTPPTKATFFRRRFTPLFTAWAIALGVAGLIYWFERSMPAFHEVVNPFYWIIATLIAFGTWRWVRTRAKQSHDRRAADRRLAERRHETTDQPMDPPVA